MLRISSISIRSRLGQSNNIQTQQHERLFSFKAFANRSSNAVKPSTESSTATTAAAAKPSASSSSNNNVNNHYNRQLNNSVRGGYHQGNNKQQGRGSAPSNYNANGQQQQQQQHAANNNKNNRLHRLRSNNPSNNNNTNRGPQNNSRGPPNNNRQPASWQQNQRQQQDNRFKQQQSNSNNSASSSLHNFVSRNNNREAAKSMSKIRQPTATASTTNNIRQPTANTSNVRQSQQQQPSAASSSSRPLGGGNDNMNKRVDNDIRDISQLRNTFIKSPQSTAQSQSTNVRMRGTPLSSTVAAVNSNSLGGLQPLKGGQKNDTKGNVDAVAASVGVGSKWTPSSYRKKITPPPSSQTPSTPSSASGTQSSTTQQVVSQESNNNNNHRLSSSWKHPRSSSTGAGLIPPMSKRAPIPQSILSPSTTTTTPNTQSAQPQQQQQGIKSMEQVLKDNALQRKYNMEQTYINAGQRIPQTEEQESKPKAAADMIRDNKPNWRRAQPGINRRQHPGSGRFDNNNSSRGRYNQRGVGYNNNNNQGRYNNNNQYQNRTLQRKEQQRKQIRKHLPSSTPTSIKLPSSPLTLVDLSLLLRVRKRTLVRTIRSLGESIAYTTANQDSYKISLDMMELICIELGIESTIENVEVSSVELAERRAMRISSSNSETSSEEERTEEEEKYALLPPRSPVVSIMGHVDHGKTTLMDMLRSRAVTNTNDGSKKGSSKASTSKSKKKKKSSKKSKDTSNKSRGDKNGIDGNVAGTEAGGITQVITAFEVPLPLEESTSEDDDAEYDSQNISTVTFLDTPGHAAFKKMRQSGSSATDVIVLVVAADDGVSPQTIEIINMYKSIARLQPTSISLVVAVTKIDKPGIDIDESVMRIENQLIEHEIYTENVLSGGGDDGEFGSCQLFPVSGVTGDGVDDLIEGLAFQSEIMDLRADEDANGEGIVIDARMEKGLGVVADCVIRWGCVNKGDFVVSGTNGGRVKFLNDVGNKPLKSKARPSQPVRIVGFKTLPKAGDPIVCANSEDEAKELIRLRESELSNEERAEFESDVELQITGTAAKNNMMMQNARNETGFDDLEGMGNNETVRIPVVIKADSHGSLEAVRDALVSIGTDSKLDIIIDPVEMSTGVVTSSDVDMARISEAAIFAFGKVGTADKETKNLAEADGVSIRSHDIIYRLLEDAKEVFAKYLPVTIAEKIHGKGKVQAVFDVTDSKKQSVSIAGLRVTDGNLFKAKSSGGSDGQEPLSCFYRVLRNGKLLSEDVEKLSASSLRKVKEDVDSVRKGEECGLGLTGFNDLEEGDIVECYSLEDQIPDI